MDFSGKPLVSNAFDDLAIFLILQGSCTLLVYRIGHFTNATTPLRFCCKSLAHLMCFVVTAQATPRSTTEEVK